MILAYLKLTADQMDRLTEARGYLSTVSALVEAVREEARDWLDEQPIGTHDDQDRMGDEIEELREMADSLEALWGELEGVVPLEKDGSYGQS